LPVYHTAPFFYENIDQERKRTDPGPVVYPTIAREKLARRCGSSQAEKAFPDTCAVSLWQGGEVFQAGLAPNVQCKTGQFWKDIQMLQAYGSAQLWRFCLARAAVATSQYVGTAGVPASFSSAQV